MASTAGWRQDLKFQKPSTNVVSPSCVPHSTSLQSEDLTRSGTNFLTSGHSQTAVQIETNTVMNEDEPPPPYTVLPSPQQNFNFPNDPANALATTTPVDTRLATPNFHYAGTRTTRKKQRCLAFVFGFIAFLCLFAIVAFIIINLIQIMSMKSTPIKKENTFHEFPKSVKNVLEVLKPQFEKSLAEAHGKTKSPEVTTKAPNSPLMNGFEERISISGPGIFSSSYSYSYGRKK